MAQIDPSIAMSIRPAQIESPLVHAARAAELQGAQQSQFMNMLKMKEYADESRNKNAMTKWLSGKTAEDLNSDSNLNELATKFGPQGLALAKQIDDRRKARSEAAYRTEQTEDLKSQRVERRYKLGKTQTEDAIKTISGLANRQQALNLLYQSEVNGTIPPEAAESIRSIIPYDDEEFPAFKQSLIERLMTADQRVQYGERQAASREKQADQAYSEYVYDAADRGETPMPKAAFLASFRQQPAPDAAPVAAPTVTQTPAPTEAAGVAPNGDRMLPGVERVEGFFGVHPQAAAFYRAGNKEMGDKIQAAHVEQKKREQLTGDFQNVMVAEQMIAELERNPTPLNLKKIAALRKQIKAANEGRAPKNYNIVKMPPGPKAVDEKYAQEYLDWSLGGGADAAANMGQIKSVLDRLASGEALTGKAIGLAPDFFNALVNPAALGAKQQVEEVVQRNLRAVLGAQFTQVEGERLISRAFDARLSPQENVKRLRKLFMQMQTAAQQRQAMAEYYEANETLRGYKGKQPKMQDFYDALSTPDAPPKGSVDVRVDGRMKRFESQADLDAFKAAGGKVD